MSSLVVLVIIVALVALAYRHLNQSQSRIPRRWRDRVRDAFAPPYAVDGPPRSELSMALFNSIANPQHARAADGKIFIEPGDYVALASPRDAAIIHGSPSFFNEDVNKLIELNRVGMRLICSGAINVYHVIADEMEEDSRPRLVTQHEASRKFPGTERSAAPTPKIPDVRHDEHPTTKVPRAFSAAGGVLQPRTPGLMPISVTAPGQSLGRNPRHGHGQINLDTVSWNHAQVEPNVAQDAWTIRELKAKHGTFVNDRNIAGLAGGSVLADGDVIKIGKLGEHAEYVWATHDPGYTPTGE